MPCVWASGDGPGVGGWRGGVCRSVRSCQRDVRPLPSPRLGPEASVPASAPSLAPPASAAADTVKVSVQVRSGGGEPQVTGASGRDRGGPFPSGRLRSARATSSSVTATPQGEASDLAGRWAKMLAVKPRPRPSLRSACSPCVTWARLPVPNRGSSRTLWGPGAYHSGHGPCRVMTVRCPPQGPRLRAVRPHPVGDAGGNQSGPRPHAVASSPRAPP